MELTSVVDVTDDRVATPSVVVVEAAVPRRIGMSPLGGAVTVVRRVEVDKDSAASVEPPRTFVTTAMVITETIAIDPHMAIRFSRSGFMWEPPWPGVGNDGGGVCW